MPNISPSDISSIIVFVLFTFGSLAIAAVVPNSQLKLESGLLQALTTMLTAVKMKWALYILAFCIAFGSLGGVLSWISGPSKGLLTTAKDGLLPEKLAETTKSGAPKNYNFSKFVLLYEKRKCCVLPSFCSNNRCLYHHVYFDVRCCNCFKKETTKP